MSKVYVVTVENNEPGLIGVYSSYAGAVRAMMDYLVESADDWCIDCTDILDATSMYWWRRNTSSKLIKIGIEQCPLDDR